MGYIVEIINHSNKVFWNDNILFFAAFIVSLTILFSQREEKNTAKKAFAVFSLIAVLFFCYNPLIYMLFTKVIPDSDEGVYGRVWMAIPVLVIVALAFTEVIKRVKSQTACNAICIGAGISIVIVGSSLVFGGYYKDADTIYKADSRGIAIAERVLESSGGEQAGVLVFQYDQIGEGNYTKSDSISNAIIQYTGELGVTPYYNNEQTLQTFYYSDVILDSEMLTEEYMAERFTWLRGQYDFSYVVIPHEESLDEKMLYCGYELVDCVENYDIYKAMPRWYVQSYAYLMENNGKLYVISDNCGHCIVIGGGCNADRKQLELILSSYGKKIDAWIIPCPSAENLEGFNKIVETEGYMVGDVYIPAIDPAYIQEGTQDALCYVEFIEHSDNGVFSLHELKEADEFDLYGLSFIVLSDMLDIHSGDMVDNAMLIQMKTADTGFLFCSSIGFDQGQSALNKYGSELKSDYVQIASGDGTGLGETFYDAVNPGVAFCDSIRDDAGRSTYDLLIASGVTCFCIENGSTNMVIIE